MREGHIPGNFGSRRRRSNIEVLYVRAGGQEKAWKRQ